MTSCVAITGATGYLGGLLGRRFSEEGWDVARLVRSPDGVAERRFVLGDSVSAGTLEGVDLLIHAAYDMKVVSELDIWRVNVDGTRLLLDAAAAAGVGRTIVLSSMSAYVGTKQLYGRAKLDIEAIAAGHGAMVVRPGLVMGAEAGGMAGALARLVALPLTPTITGGRQFPISADDFVEAMYRLATCPAATETPVGLASPKSIPFDELLRTIAASSGRRPPRLVPIPWQIIYAGLRIGERLGLSLPFRADSLLGLVRPAPRVPGQDALAGLGLPLERSL